MRANSLYSRWGPKFATAVAVLALTLVTQACSVGGGTSSAPTAATGTATTASATATTGAGATAPTPITVKVYFSRHPETDSNVSAVFPVNRTSPSLQVATYAIQQLIVGPSASETAAGYFTELPASLTTASNCGGPDFQITLNSHVDTHAGTSSAQTGAAVLRFCRGISLAGDLTGGRISAQIVATLKQFPTITKTQILTNTNHCFNDLSGLDNC